MRKQLLLLRSATERAELAYALTAVRQSVTVFGKAAPALAMGRGVPLVLGLLKRAPLLSPLLSLALAGARRPVLRYGALAAGAVFVAWKAWQWLAGQGAQASQHVAPQSTSDAPE
ncbi:hypothetical protein [Polaromonas sp.]|uniref:hypothetical protein n=1 Tax=Polaromonas sp. TaxID=1869339 RepID=UPI00374FFEB9